MLAKLCESVDVWLVNKQFELFVVTREFGEIGTSYYFQIDVILRTLCFTIKPFKHVAVFGFGDVSSEGKPQ